MRIEIPTISIWDGNTAVTKILKVIEPTLLEDCFILCFNYCNFITTDAVAILAGTKLLRDQRGLRTEIDITTLNSDLGKYLDGVGFLKLFGYEEGRIRQSTLPIYIKTQVIKEEVTDYIDQQIMQRHEFPEMSDELHKHIRISFFEVFGNVFHHSKSEIGGLVCGQFYPNPKEIQIVFLDAGMGMAESAKQVVVNHSDQDAISWALQRGTSTLSNHSSPRGLGLFLLSDFIRANQGTFRVYANNGFVEEAQGEQNTKALDCPLNGTLIEMRINVKDDVIYTYRENGS